MGIMQLFHQMYGGIKMKMENLMRGKQKQKVLNLNYILQIMI